MLFKKIDIKDMKIEDVINTYCAIWKSDEFIGIALWEDATLFDVDARPILESDDLTNVLSTKALSIIEHD